MKNNKVLVIIGIIFLNLLVVYMVGQSLLGKGNKYDETLVQARTYADEELCSKSLAAYREATALEDSVELRMEMLKVYHQGLESGEFTQLYSFYSEITDMVETYREDIRVYEKACELFMEYEAYEECAEILTLAKDFHVTSKKLEKVRSNIRYKYTKNFCMYSEVFPECNGMYTVLDDDSYTYLDAEASSAIDKGYIYASSFSQGYAFVKIADSEETEKSFVINQSGQRQFYIEGAVASSGVGKAQDNEGEEVLLLACNMGENYQYYDMNGKKMLGEYVFAGRFRNNIAAVQEAEGEWKLIDGTGKAITKTVFEDVVLNEFDECAPKGLIFAKKDGKYHLYDMQGKQIGDFSCDGAKAFVDDYAAFQEGDMWGFVNAEGKVVIESQYEDAKSFSNKMGAVKIGEQWSFINPSNKIVIEGNYEDVSYLSDKGICFVKENGYWSYLEMYYIDN